MKLATQGKARTTGTLGRLDKTGGLSDYRTLSVGVEWGEKRAVRTLEALLVSGVKRFYYTGP